MVQAVKKQYKPHYKKLISLITSDVIDKIISECYKGDRQGDIARKYGVTTSFVGFLKRRYERENLYGQHTGRKGNN